MDAPASPLKVMLANEPRAYREVISAVFKALRPDVEVFTVEPEDLDREFKRRVPQLVIFSRLTGLVGRDAYAWIELYPGGASHAVVSLAGERTTYKDMDLETLLSILDRVAADVYQRPRRFYVCQGAVVLRGPERRWAEVEASPLPGVLAVLMPRRQTL